MTRKRTRRTIRPIDPMAIYRLTGGQLKEAMTTVIQRMQAGQVMEVAA